MGGARVPEATVDEHSNSRTRKDYVGPYPNSPSHNGGVFAETETARVQSRAQRELGSGISPSVTLPDERSRRTCGNRIWCRHSGGYEDLRPSCSG
jgi:hypothetical protein